MGRDIAAEYTRLQCLHMSTDICLRSHKMTFEHIPMGFLVSVWHNHISAVGFNLRQLSGTFQNEGGVCEP